MSSGVGQSIVTDEPKALISAADLPAWPDLKGSKFFVEFNHELDRSVAEAEQKVVEAELAAGTLNSEVGQKIAEATRDFEKQVAALRQEFNKRIAKIRMAAEKLYATPNMEVSSLKEYAKRRAAEAEYTRKMLDSFRDTVMWIAFSYNPAPERPDKYMCLYCKYDAGRQLTPGSLLADKFKDVLALFAPDGRGLQPRMFKWVEIPEFKKEYKVMAAFLDKLPDPFISCVILKRDVSISVLKPKVAFRRVGRPRRYY